LYPTFVVTKTYRMVTGLLHLHSVLRWIILILLLITIYQAFSKKAGLQKTSLWLLISAHIMLLLGIYQLIWGRFGITKGLPEGVELMKNSFYRFFWVEHPAMMLLAIILITLARGKARVLQYRATGWLLLIALLLILAAVPWPFRAVGAGRGWLPGCDTGCAIRDSGFLLIAHCILPIAYLAFSSR